MNCVVVFLHHARAADSPDEDYSLIESDEDQCPKT